ncbi:MAG: zinc-ribbon domain-containing protein [Clostridia bacterium]|nr:zinc-ribbon domain-containing protein [Clostridia bacterium]
MYCQKCGKQIEEGVKFCDGCGNPADDGNVQQPTIATDGTEKKKEFKRIPFIDKIIKEKNEMIWVAAFAPFIGFSLEIFFLFIFGWDLWFITLLINILFCYLDCYLLGRSGTDTGYLDKTFFLMPVYMFKRAKLNGDSLAYFVTWCICFAVVTLIWAVCSDVLEAIGLFYALL